MDCVRINKKDAQLRTQSIPLASSKPVSFAGLLPNDSVHTFSSSVPIMKAIARKFIMNYVRRGKDSNYSIIGHISTLKFTTNSCNIIL